jgi:CubicO group peptidase (beta-lactamase class C family)
MADSVFYRSDELPGRAATGYLDDGRTNVFCLPVVGSGDGGAYSTVADVACFWSALRDGRLLPPELLDRMTHPSTVETGTPFGYGIGVWLDLELSLLVLEGCDHGVSFRSLHDPASGRTVTVAGNTTQGAFPVVRWLRSRVWTG